jgi:carbamoyltransferase
MVICGLKLTHDGAIALIDNGKLVFCIEMEKLNNNPRFTEILDTSIIEEILVGQGYPLSSVDYFAIDGWGGYNIDALAVQPRLEIGETHNKLEAFNNSKKYQLDIAAYRERTLEHDVCKGLKFSGLQLNGSMFDYYSYTHVSGHILGTYCTSPFAERGESAYILVWDGGMYPRMYFYNVGTNKTENLGPIFLLIGNIYTIFSQHFGPFKVDSGFAKDSLSVAGKVMAYIAKGQVREELFDHFEEIYNQYSDAAMGFANVFANEFKKRIKDAEYSDEDILMTFHVYLERLLVTKIEKKIKRTGKRSANLCISGGCGLNIKWNSSIRKSKIISEIYIPPFPNDSGSAIGAACNVLVQEAGINKLDWNVFSGPEIIENTPAEGWAAKPCTIKELAKIIYETDEPVVVLNGKAELGPRALGNRSILASPTSPTMKGILNKIKKREDYRPVSPMCLEEEAEAIFSPGTPDPYMLFDHDLKDEWKDKIPAIMHLDGSARLQTVSLRENKMIVELLKEYKQLSGIPVLCNTSANFNGKGFFCDVYSATSWNQTNYVWCNEKLYTRKELIEF